METLAASAPSTLEGFREQQRRQIAGAVLTCVGRDGFVGANVTEVVRAAGISRKTFYKYFSTIEEAILFTQTRLMEDVWKSQREAVRAPGSALDRYISTLHVTNELAAEHPDWLRFISFFDIAYRDFALTEESLVPYRSLMGSYAQTMFGLIEDGQRDGSIRSDLPVEVILAGGTNSMFGVAVRGLSIPELYTDPGLLDRLLDIEIAFWRDFLSVNSAQRP